MSAVSNEGMRGLEAIKGLRNVNGTLRTQIKEYASDVTPPTASCLILRSDHAFKCAAICTQMNRGVPPEWPQWYFDYRLCFAGETTPFDLAAARRLVEGASAQGDAIIQLYWS